MEKLCVFCGKKPRSKTLEHVIPNWLLEITGNPNRIAQFGYKNLGNPEKEPQKRLFSFNSFKFPACDLCNNQFALLEETVKTIFLKILSEDNLSVFDFDTLLNWFDKIRIGLWLSYRYLDENQFGVTPHYYIENRIGQHDRFLLILKASGNHQGINFVGCYTPSFAFTPCCFLIQINGYFFLNISLNNLLSRRMGFPYPTDTYFTENDQILCDFTLGRNRIMRPILKKWFNLRGTELYQPIFKGNVISLDKTLIQYLYGNDYVRNNCISWEKGTGKVFIESRTGVKGYPEKSSKIWIPPQIYNFNTLLFESQIFTLEWQLFLEELRPNLNMVSKEKRALLEYNKYISKDYNKHLISILREKAYKAGIHTAR